MPFKSVIHAYTQTVLTEVKMDTEIEALKKLKNLYEFFKNKKNHLSILDRQKILEKTKQIIIKNKEKIMKISVKEGGKPLKDTILEFDRAIFGFDLAIRELNSFCGEMVPMGLFKGSKNHLAFTIKEPRGVIFSVSAFNHPINLTVHQIVPAIAANCPVLFKPSLKTPLTTAFLIECFKEAGLPENMCEYTLIENDITTKLVQSPYISYLSFVGSSKVGWYLRSKLAPGADCSLEHGGLAPSIIDECYDIKSIMPGLLRSAFYHAGQVCISLQRVFIHKSKIETFIVEFLESIKNIKLGDPEDINTDIGPLISPTEINRVDFIVKEAIQKGAKLIFGGEKIGNSLYSPTLLLNPSDDALISKEEVFGPVLALYSYTDLKDAIKQANNTEYAFHSSIFTKNIDKALNAFDDFQASGVMINEWPTFRVDNMPFGGAKLSGLKLLGIKNSMKEFSLDKLLVIKMEGQNGD